VNAILFPAIIRHGHSALSPEGSIPETKIPIVFSARHGYEVTARKMRG
jgi:hypothetical protein